MLALHPDLDVVIGVDPTFINFRDRGVEDAFG
jgi:hypothetical protein